MSSHCNLDEDEQPGDELERAEAGAGVLESNSVERDSKGYGSWTGSGIIRAIRE